MKTHLLAGMLALLSAPAFAQFQIGDAGTPAGGRAGALKSDDVETLKKTTTIFALRKEDAPYVDMFRTSLADVWTITPFRMVTADSARFFRGKKFSLFDFGSFEVSKMNSRTNMSETSSEHLTYDLTLPNFKKNGEQDGRTILARFILGYNFALKTITPAAEGVDQYSPGKLANWGPGQIRGNVKSINDLLISQTRRGITDEITEKEALKALRSDTLYLPTYLRGKISFTRGAQTSDQEETEQSSAEAYPFPHRYVSSGELEGLLVHPAKPTYHLICVLSIPYKYISVVEAQSGRIVYSRFANLSYAFKMRDLKDLAKLVD